MFQANENSKQTEIAIQINDKKQIGQHQPEEANKVIGNWQREQFTKENVMIVNISMYKIS